MAVTAAVSPSNRPQSSTGRFEVTSLVDDRETDGLGEVALARAGGSEEDSVFGPLEETPRGELEDQGAVGLRVELEVEAIEGLVRIAEAGLLDAPGQQSVLSSLKLVLD